MIDLKHIGETLNVDIKKVDCVKGGSGFLCVLGIMDNNAGREIGRELLSWLVDDYTVYVVKHDGSKYEYPALAFASSLSQNTDSPVLYIHTKGAFFKRLRTHRIRKMWKNEFTTFRQRYFNVVNSTEPKVATPFSGSEKVTWYNAFVANSSAYKAIGEIKITKDRYYYERLFQNTPVEVVGMIFENIDSLNKSPMHRYIDINYEV